MAYAAGKKALGICDRCGFTYKLNELRYETENKVRNGLRVCHTCYDPDQPQLDVNLISTIDPLYTMQELILVKQIQESYLVLTL